jgi:TRAP-type C4-dicarboxylate transport system substrate-binding protein
MPLRTALLFCALVFACGGEAAAQVTARLSYHWAVDHESAVMSKKFADEVNKRGAGKIRIDVFPGGQLYTIRQVLGALSAGSVELGGVVTHNQFPSVDRDWNVVQFPNVFGSIEQQRKFFSDTPEGRALRERILQKTGLVHLAYVPTGPYVTFSVKSDMSTVASMKGLKARTLAPAERAGFAARGASVVSLSTEEIYSALQSGMIDTLTTVPTAAKAFSWFDFLKFAQLPAAVYTDAAVMANGKWYAGLPQDVQQLLLDVGAQISREATESTYRSNDQALKEFAARGGKITVLKGAQLEEFLRLDREKTEPEMAKGVSPEIYAALLRYIGRK